MRALVVALVVAGLAAASTRAHTSTSPDAPLPPPQDAPPGTWSFAGVPRITLNADEGVGLGVRGTVFWHRFRTRPYKTAISFQVWGTTRLVQHHFVRLDAIDAFHLPLRLEAETGFFSTLTLPFCGDPPVRPCDDDDSTRVRSMEPYGTTTARVRVHRQPFFRDTLKVEAFVGWRGTHYVPGTMFDDDGDGEPDLFPYPGSRYAALHPRGEPGFASVLQAGVVIDTRDDEPNPTRGFFVDASVRDAQPQWGSAFAFAGANATGRLYVPLLASGAAVVAQRVIVDGIVGDAPWRERVRLGGLVETNGIGGLDVGRGIRLARYAGHVRLAHQHELRVTPLVLDVWGNSLAVPLAAFVDTGLSVSGGDDDLRLLVGGGVSVRVVWNRTFVMRLDLAVSPEEPGRLAAYSAPGHPW